MVTTIVGVRNEETDWQNEVRDIESPFASHGPIVLPLYEAFTSGSTGQPKGGMVGDVTFCKPIHFYPSTVGLTSFLKFLQFL